MASAIVFGNAAFGQGLQISGTVTALTNTQITLTCDEQTWYIKRTSTTTPHHITNGDTLTVRCKSPDAQKKE
jgi:hypothetical protein